MLSSRHRIAALGLLFGLALPILACGGATELASDEAPAQVDPAPAVAATPMGGGGKIAYYVNPKQAYMLFGTPLSDLVYGFYDDKFFAVYAGLEAIDTYGAIKSQIQQKLGVPKISMEARGGLTTYSWKTGDTRIKMKHYGASGAMKLSFYHLPIANQVNAELQKEMDDEPPEPLFPLSRTRQKEAVELLELFNY